MGRMMVKNILGCVSDEWCIQFINNIEYHFFYSRCVVNS